MRMQNITTDSPYDTNVIERSKTASQACTNRQDAGNVIPYTMEELNARIDEAEAEIERNEGKTFSEMMNGFRKELSPYI